VAVRDASGIEGRRLTLYSVDVKEVDQFLFAERREVWCGENTSTDEFVRRPELQRGADQANKRETASGYGRTNFWWLTLQYGTLRPTAVHPEHFSFPGAGQHEQSGTMRMWFEVNRREAPFSCSDSVRLRPAPRPTLLEGTVPYSYTWHCATMSRRRSLSISFPPSPLLSIPPTGATSWASPSDPPTVSDVGSSRVTHSTSDVGQEGQVAGGTRRRRVYQLME
jgi:hypothetical protein